MWVLLFLSSLAVQSVIPSTFGIYDLCCHLSSFSILSFLFFWMAPDSLWISVGLTIISGNENDVCKCCDDRPLCSNRWYEAACRNLFVWMGFLKLEYPRESSGWYVTRHQERVIDSCFQFHGGLYVRVFGVQMVEEVM